MVIQITILLKAVLMKDVIYTSCCAIRSWIKIVWSLITPSIGKANTFSALEGPGGKSGPAHPGDRRRSVTLFYKGKDWDAMLI